MILVWQAAANARHFVEPQIEGINFPLDLIAISMPGQYGLESARAITLSTFADSRYSRFPASNDVFEGTLSTAVERFGGHCHPNLKFRS